MTRIMKKAPIVNSSRLASDNPLPPYDEIGFPHSGQNFECAGMDLPHLGHLMASVDGGVKEFPHSGQNLLVAGTLELHLGHMTSAAALAACVPVGVMICGISTIPVPRAAPPPPDLPSDSAALFIVSMRKTSSGEVLPVLSQKRRSRYSGVVSMPSKRISVSSMPTRLK